MIGSRSFIIFVIKYYKKFLLAGKKTYRPIFLPRWEVYHPLYDAQISYFDT